MKLAQILNARKSLESVIAKNAEMSVKASYKIVRFILDTNQFEIDFNNELGKIREKFAEKKEDGTASVPEEKTQEFYDEVNQLGLKDVEFGNAVFSLSDFEGVKIGANEMFALADFFTE